MLYFGEFQALLLLINNSNPTVYNLREHQDQGDGTLLSALSLLVMASIIHSQGETSNWKNSSLPDQSLFTDCLARNKDKESSGVVDYPWEFVFIFIL